MRQFLESYYDIALKILQLLGGNPGGFGLGYEIVNVLIFIIIQPGLIILFILLWQKQKRKNQSYSEDLPVKKEVL